jgi:tRNA-2-methylthio-N6-dimethylallyladenosine synthase
MTGRKGMTVRKRAYVETYGCQMNVSDGELMSGILAAEGYEIVDRPEEADIVLVNTCAVREHAERRVLGRVAQLNGLKQEKEGMILGVTGCMAQRMGEGLLRRAPWVDLVMGPDGYRSLPGALRELLGRRGSGEPGGSALAPPAPGGGRNGREGSRSLTVLNLDPRESYEELEPLRTSRVSAWVSIQRGCDHRCTFCIVPHVRGPEKNRAPGSILAEVRAVVAKGISEVTLLGQTVNSYRFREDGEWSFPRLLGEVARTPGIRRVRFTSPHPNDVTPELVEVMASEEAVCEQLHLPLQAGNDRTLRRMLRRHTVDDFLEKVDMVRDAVPDIALSTDLIAGFPGETEAEFRDTLDMVARIRFDEAFTYRYSPREGTPATRLPPEDFISPEIGQDRLDRLIDLTRTIQAEINRDEVGRVEEVLVEKEGREEGDMLGRTRRGKVAVFPGNGELLGTYRTVELVRTTGATFAAAQRKEGESTPPRDETLPEKEEKVRRAS